MTQINPAGTASTSALLASRFQSSQHRDSCLAQNTFYYVVCQPRGVVVKMEEIVFLVVTKLLKPVSIRELAQCPKMLRLEAFLQFVGCGH
jgi:hypothetical protein